MKMLPRLFLLALPEAPRGGKFDFIRLTIPTIKSISSDSGFSHLL